MAYSTPDVENLSTDFGRLVTSPDPQTPQPLLTSRESSKALVSRASSETWGGFRSDVLNYGLRNVFRVNARAQEVQRHLMAAFDPCADGKIGVGEAVYTTVLAFTGWLIGATLEATSNVLSQQDVAEESRDFATLALLASGPRARDLISAFFALELLGFAVTNTAITAINASLVTGLPTSSLILLSTLVSFALTYVSARALAYVSAASFVAVGIAAGAVAWGGLGMPVLPAVSHASLHVGGLPHALGIVLFAFSGQPCLPSSYWTMRDRSQYSLASFVAFLVSMTFYGVVASLSYYFYGDALQRIFTENIGRDLAGNPLPGLQALQLVTCAAFAVKVQGGIPLVVGPIATSVENSLGVSPEQSGRKEAVKVLTLTSTTLLALFFQDALDVFCSIAGSALTMTTSVIFPSWAYWRLGPVHGRFMRTTLMVTMAGGVSFAVYGTIDALRSLAA